VLELEGCRDGRQWYCTVNTSRPCSVKRGSREADFYIQNLAYTNSWVCKCCTVQYCTGMTD
jgi:hypothetical protein